MKEYQAWEDAARASYFKSAVSEARDAVLDGGKKVRIEIVKPLHGQEYATYAGAPGIRVHGLRLSTRDVDSVRRWRPW